MLSQFVLLSPPPSPSLPCSQHQSVSPSAYAVLQYTGAPQGAWPLTPPPQPGILPWSIEQQLMVRVQA